MCGIFAILNYSKQNSYKFSDDFYKGQHRGPESSRIHGIYHGWFSYLGFHRLAINGCDEKSNQPFNFDYGGLICNGEIYNWKELYKIVDKDGTKRNTNSDCEVIIHLYRQFGIEQTLQMLDGVFAFVLYDPLNECMYVARDTYGVRPLFEGVQKGETRVHDKHIFTSEMKMSGFEDVKFKQFEPGTYSKYRYEDLNSNNDSRDRECKLVPEYTNRVFSKPTSFVNECIYNEQMACELIHNTLVEAVRKRVDNTERDIACLLSGGLDSSLICGIVTRCLREQGKKIKLNTWSIGLEGSEDIEYARKVAEYIGSEHHEIIVSEKEFLDYIKKVIYDIESYDTTTVRASVGNWLISKYISETSESKVIFNGDGSDEVCGGYMYFHASPNSIDFDKECRKLLKNIHYFDVLRSDRSISSHGLEARTPFLDRNFVQSYLSIPIDLRNHKKNNQCEKYLLRKAFEGRNIIPDEILWRTKEAFSDGVSKQSRSWFEIIQEYVKNNIFENDFKTGKSEKEIIDDWVKTCNITHNIPTTLEQTYYRMIFELDYRGQGKTIPYFWMPNFVEATDASARTLKDYKDRMKHTDKEMDKETNNGKEKNEVKQINESTISI